MDNTLRCIHRQDINHHPNCFRKGLIKHPKILTLEHYRDASSEWYNSLKVCFFDIETTGLEGADVELMISWAIKERGANTKTGLITKDELFDLSFDKRIVEECIDELQNYHVIVGYYSKRFDIPFLRTKALYYNLPFFWYDDMYSIDLFDTVKGKLSLTRRSLRVATEYLGIAGKTDLNRQTWLKARYGDEKSLQYVLEHNIQDVSITEKLFTTLNMMRKLPKSKI